MHEALQSAEGRKAIRLIRLYPSGHPEEDLWCSFSTTTLAAGPQVENIEDNSGCSLEPYTALSYTWGRREDPEYIFVFPSSTGDTDSHLRITKNLHEALIHLRHPTNEVVMWVDAICINQGDLVERDSQLQIMGQIYPSASTVCACLGADSSSQDGKFCLELIEDLVLLKEESSMTRPAHPKNRIRDMRLNTRYNLGHCPSCKMETW